MINPDSGKANDGSTGVQMNEDIPLTPRECVSIGRTSWGPTGTSSLPHSMPKECSLSGLGIR